LPEVLYNCAAKVQNSRGPYQDFPALFRAAFIHTTPLIFVTIAVNTRFLLPGQLEGFGWYTHEIVRRMVLQHPEDHFIFLFDRPFDPRFVYASNVTPLVVSPPARHPILFRLWFEFSVPRVLRRHGAEVFFSPDSMCSFRTPVPTVMTCHDLVPLHFPEQIAVRHRRFLLKFIPKWLHRAEKVLTVSEFVRTDIIDTCAIAADKVVAVYNGCRDGFFPLRDTEKQAVRVQYADGYDYFFYAGAIHPRKNVPRLLRAFDQFKVKTGASVKLLLAGRFAWQTGEVRSVWEASQYRDDIHFLGYVGEEALPRLTAAAMASVYVSISEGFGLPLVEAMACETPVITSNTSCLPEVAGVAALLVDPFSETAIAAGMEKIYADRAFANQLVLKGREQLKKFSWDSAAEQVYALLKTTAKHP
jgi:glycosyltransferase involved in cell wall biosynthesis